MWRGTGGTKETQDVEGAGGLGTWPTTAGEKR